MTERAKTAAALTLFLGSGALLAGALGFQYIGGLPPCELCIWQRLAHVAVLCWAGAALLVPGRTGRISAFIAGAAMAGSVAVASFHAGVEQGWWQGFTACTAAAFGALTVDDMMKAIEAAPVIRCDAIPWSWAGLSMAAWNAVLSLALLIAAALLYRRFSRP